MGPAHKPLAGCSDYQMNSIRRKPARTVICRIDSDRRFLSSSTLVTCMSFRHSGGTITTAADESVENSLCNNTSTPHMHPSLARSSAFPAWRLLFLARVPWEDGIVSTSDVSSSISDMHAGELTSLGKRSVVIPISESTANILGIS